MKRFSLSVVVALTIIAVTSVGRLWADDLFVDEDFKAGNPNLADAPGGYASSKDEVVATQTYKDGVGVNGSRAMVLDMDFLAVKPTTLAAIQFMRVQVTGNDGAEASKCFIEFAAKGSKPSAEVQVIVNGTTEPYYGGTPTGTVATTIKLPDTPGTFQVYRIALGDPALKGTFNPTGKTLQITFQVFGSVWGKGADNQLVIDNVKFGKSGP